ncbi:MAG: glycerophosphodiester phosphodiesterase family protein [Gammaproteobacteria bacterium]|nr:glycerophosphodiester phosphodiesterase family protein [Gammaproteobacteria bacterium]
MTEPVQLVAHRGEPDSFPENSLEGFAHALRAGATYLETDVQLTADGVVVLSHDEDLRRLTGKAVSVTKNNYIAFKEVSAGYPEKFSNRFDHCRIATLEQFVDLLQHWPGVICFIEIKPESVVHFGHEMVVDWVMESLRAIEAQSVLISFDYDALVLARSKYHRAVGWVLSGWTEGNRIKAEALAPEYLFVSKNICPQKRAEVWPGPWRWVVYTVNDSDEIAKFTALGINIIETNGISRMTDAVKDDADN